MPLAIGLGVERRAEALRISTSSRNLNGVTATSAGPWSCPDDAGAGLVDIEV